MVTLIEIEGGGNGSDGDATDLRTDNVLRPTIKTTDNTENDTEQLEVQPVATEEVTAITENDNRKHRTLCGETYIEPIGEDEWRITINGHVVLSQLEDLIDMRPANNPLDILTTVDEYKEVEFDRFEWRQDEEMNQYRGRVSDGNGNVVEEPLFEFTLQTRDDEQ